VNVAAPTSTILEHDLFYSAYIWSVISSTKSRTMRNFSLFWARDCYIGASFSVDCPLARRMSPRYLGWGLMNGECSNESYRLFLLLPLEFRAYLKLSWPKARKRIRANWPKRLLGNSLWTHWEQQWITKKTKPLGLLGVILHCLKFGFMSKILYCYIVCHHFQVRLIMAGIYNNWEAYFIVSYTRICFTLPLSRLYCNISWYE